MSHRIAAFIAMAALTALAACAHDQRPSVAEAARAACEEEHVEASAMERCISQMSESIEAARAYHRSPPPRPSQSQSSQHSSSPRG